MAMDTPSRFNSSGVGGRQARVTHASHEAPAAPRGLSLHHPGLLLVAGATVVWSFGGLLSRLIHVDAWTMVFWRASFCALFLFSVIVLSQRGRALEQLRGMGRAGLLVALGFAGASTCFVVALSRASVAEVLVVFSTAPFLAALIGRLFLQERIRFRTWLTMVMALAGIVIMVSSSAITGSIGGVLLALLSTLC